MEDNNILQLEQEEDRSEPFGKKRGREIRWCRCGHAYFDGDLCEVCHDPEWCAETDPDPPE